MSGSDFDKLEKIYNDAMKKASAENYIELKGARHVLIPLTAKPSKDVATKPTRMADPFWREQPLAFEEFVVSPIHMNQPPLSPRQASDIREFLGFDPKKVFLDPETFWREAVLLWGKGSGKDWISSLVQAWLIYILLCMHDPRTILRMPAGESTDIVNVAYSKSQAEDVFFAKFTGRLVSWKWLSDRYLIIDGGTARNREKHPNISPRKEGSDDRVISISADMVEFPFGIRAHSKHSQNESWEGLNILFAVMDEASAFRDKGQRANAHAVHGTLRSSAQRFPTLFRIMILSWPRKKRADFTIKMYQEAIEGFSTDVFASKAAVWEVNPKAKKEHYAEDYRKDPEGAAAKYECNPPASDINFMDERNVANCFIHGMESTIQSVVGVMRSKVKAPTGGMVDHTYIGRKIDQVVVRGLGDRSTPRVVAIDGGSTTDRGAMIVAHGIPEEITHDPGDGSPAKTYVVNKVVVDAALLWSPDKTNKILVSLNNMASFVGELREWWNIRAVAYDHFQSYSSIESMVNDGIYCEAHNVNSDDYGSLKELINLQKVLLPTDEWSDHEVLKVELEELERRLTPTGNFRVDHPDDGSKDLADCLAQAARMLNDPEIRKVAQESTMPRIMVGSGGGGGGLSPFAVRPASLSGSALTPGQSVGTFDSVVSNLRAEHGRSGLNPSSEDPGVQMPQTHKGKAQTPFPRIIRG